MSENKGFRPTFPASDETQPIMRIPKDIPPPEPAPLPPTQAPAQERPAMSFPEPSQPPALRTAQQATPPNLPPAPAGKASVPGCMWMLTSGALVVALVSLAINLVLAGALLQRRAFLLTALDQTIASLDNASSASIAFNFPVSQTVNFEGDIPFKQDFDFPFKGDVRINTTIYVPIDLGPLGKQTIAVPVDTTVPVDTSVPVHIDQTFHVKTQVPIQMDVPIELSPKQPPFSDWLNQVREWLLLLRNQI